MREKIDRAFETMRSCVLCPRECRVDRLSGEKGLCETGKKARVSSYNPHFGEEAPLVGRNGSGTIFFTHCNLLCKFCQNFDISHEGYGEEVSEEQLAAIMMHLQGLGCHNINFVTPTHVVPQILSAVEIAAGKGLSVPLVYNTGGYDKVDTLKLLDGVFDIYMPDFKFWDAGIAESACNAGDYSEVAQAALKEMHRQVGDLDIDESGTAKRGILLRHLVLPGGLAGTRDVMRFVVKEISPDTYVNIMPQYRPVGKAEEVGGLGGYPSRKDFETALREARDEGILRFDERRPVFAIC